MTTLKELIRVGANVNAKDNNDSTPLHLAAYSLFDFKGKYFMSLHKETILKSNLGRFHTQLNILFDGFRSCNNYTILSHNFFYYLTKVKS